MDKNLKYITGTFLLQANEAFLNGGGLAIGEDQNVVMPKYMWIYGQKIPYVSSQAWKRWLRETLIEETGWSKSDLRAVLWNEKGNTSKVAGQLNPIDFPEDDIFGYMFAYSKREISSFMKELLKKEENGEDLDEDSKEKLSIFNDLPTEQLVRPSVFLASLLAAIQKKSPISKDEAFIHLKGDESPLPYTTGFYNADLNAIFGIDIMRIGIFDNLNSMELNPNLIEEALSKDKIKIVESGNLKINRAIFQKTNLEKYRKDCITNLLKAIAYLRGGAKLAQFGVDISPKVLICAGLCIKTPIFNNLFEIGDTKPKLNIELFKELLSDYKEKIITPVFIGLRQDYLENDEIIRKLEIIDDIKLKITTPLKISQEFEKIL